MKQAEFAKWLKCIVLISVFVGLVLSGLIIPALGSDAVGMNPELGYMYWPCLIFIRIMAIPFFVALWKVWLICDEISKDNSFCKQNTQRLKFISKLAILEVLLYFAAAIVLLILNLLHPSLLLIVLFIMFIGISIAVVTAALSHLSEKASSLKQENDLTI